MRTIADHGCRSVLLEQLERVGADFDQNELAYLAVTQKAELHVRDRLAWRLHQALSPVGLVVSREWRRADLAILDGERPLALLEAKAFYNFDIHSGVNRAKFLGYVRDDVAKSAWLAPGAEHYALTLMTNVAGIIPAHLSKHVVKYAAGIRAANKRGIPEDVRADAVALWEEDPAESIGTAVRVPMAAGTVWGLDVSVDAWLVEPRLNPRATQLDSSVMRGTEL